MKRLYTTDIYKLSEGEEIEIYGWVHELRDLGGIKFIILRDREGFLQITLKKDVVDQNLFKVFDSLGYEDVIYVKGIVKRDPRAPGQTEVIPKEIKILNKAVSPLPLDVTEKVKAEVETRFDNRVLDLRRPKIQAIFRIRDTFISAVREYLKKQGFIEIYTPKIIGAASEGGAQLFPVLYYGKEAFLSQSPQLYKQMLVIAGFEKVFEITPYFRAEESHTTRHLSEATAFDVEVAWVTLDELIDLHKEVIKYSFEKIFEECEKWLKILNVNPEMPEFIKLTFDEAKEITKKYTENIEKFDLSTEEEKALGKHFGNAIVYVTHYPEEGRPFYTMPDPENPKLTLSFDGIYKGLEIVSGAIRIHKKDLLLQKIKEKDLDPESFEFYLKAFDFGAPPHGGFGCGIERVLKQLLDLPHVREAIFFPRLPNRLIP